MRFKLFECQILQNSGTSICHIVSSDMEHASILIEDHFVALGLTEARYKLQRVDEVLPEEWGGGAELDEILENAPAGLVSFTDIGWVAHTAPVHKLRLFASEDSRGIPIYAAAPNKGVALALMVNTQLPRAGQVYTFDIRDVTDTIVEPERKNLDKVLAAGQAGIAECDEEHDGWWVW
ncbi:hypothetical protein [Erythrobacter donghaensis]|uniref:hypothetical protein n=1 Tax=Erythrobacter donghaensis TaxID=267135 RepID=UPI000A39893E|nr:hypothetical protein [Erythrobacter donghaensis]